MTRHIGPSNADRIAYTLDAANRMQGLPSRTAVFYDDPDPTAEPTVEMLTTLADIRTLAGVAIPGSAVTIGATSKYQLIQFPDGTPYGPDSLLVRIGTAAPERVYAREDDRIDAVAAGLTTETQARTAGDTATIGAAAGLAIVFGGI